MAPGGEDWGTGGTGGRGDGGTASCAASRGDRPYEPPRAAGVGSVRPDGGAARITRPHPAPPRPSGQPRPPASSPGFRPSVRAQTRTSRFFSVFRGISRLFSSPLPGSANTHQVHIPQALTATNTAEKISKNPQKPQKTSSNLKETWVEPREASPNRAETPHGLEHRVLALLRGRCAGPYCCARPASRTSRGSHAHT
jgi:hypothetical protein